MKTPHLHAVKLEFRLPERSIVPLPWRQEMDEEIRRKIVTLLDQHRIMTIATLRADGWPQATTVGYANEGLNLYFLTR